MSQTLYAFLAVVLVTTFTLVQRNIIFQNQYNTIVNDLDLLGIGVATEQLDFISSKAFDNNIPAADSTFLTPPANFGAGSVSYMTSQDIDDFHNKTLDVKLPALDDTLGFLVSVNVQYVNKVDTLFVASPSSQTNYKEITVNVQGVVDPNTGDYMSEVSLSRVMAYHE